MSSPHLRVDEHPPSGTSAGEAGPLIGVENIATPKWAAADERVATATLVQALRSLPRAIRVVLRLAWRTSPRLTVLAGVVHVVSGCVTAFGLLATADVFTALLAQGPTPQRVVDSLPAIAVVVASYAVRALLDTAVAAVEASLRPEVSRAADDEVTAAVVSVELLAFEDADFRELARQGANRGISSIDSSLREIAGLVSSAIALLAALTTAALLNAWLAPVLLLAALPDGWAAARIAKLNYQHFLDTVTRNVRKSVIAEAATYRELALERHALCLQDRLLGEYRRIAASLTRDESRLAHRSNRVRIIGRAAAGIGTGIAYTVLGILLYLGQLDLALAGTAVLVMRTATSALSNAMHEINYLYEDSFHIDFYTQLLSEAADRQAPRNRARRPNRSRGDPAGRRVVHLPRTGQPRAGRHRPDHPPRRGHRPGRRERFRQDHSGQDRHRALPAHDGNRLLERCRSRPSRPSQRARSHRSHRPAPRGMADDRPPRHHRRPCRSRGCPERALGLRKASCLLSHQRSVTADVSVYA